MLADVSMRFAAGLWTLFVESSLYILVGFAIAGLLHVWVPETFIRRILGHGRIGSIFTAALLGIPLPLCSCSVLPTAIAMRRMGASRGATVSYLISEPETGPDSIAITYGLMGPLIAVYRPAAALLAAMVAGLLVEWRGGPEVGDERAPAAGCGHDLDHGHDHDHGAGHAHDPGADAHPGHTDDPAPEPTAAADRPRLRDVRGWIGGALRYGFVDLLDDLSHWLLLGLAIGAAVTAFVPASAIGGYLGSGFLPLVLMALIGVPIYICAAASTPIAAALMLKGLSPGAALVLLLTGPATNLGSMAVLVRHLGRRVVGIYLAVVVVVSIVMGALLDALYALLGTRPEVRLGGEPGWLPGWVWTGAALLLAALLARSMLRAPIPGEFSSVARVVERLSGVRVTRRRVAWLGTAAALAAWLSTGIAVVKPGERGVRLTLGRVSHELAPGLHLAWPAPLTRTVVTPVAASRVVELSASAAGAPAAAPRSAAAAERQFLTGDRDLVEVDARVEYRAGDPAARLQEQLARLGAGVTIDRVALHQVRAPVLVVDAFRDVASAREDAATAVELARGERDAALSRARGEAAAMAFASEAARAADVARAAAEAHAFALQAAALGDWRALAERRLWLETAEAVLAGKTKIVRGDGAGARGLDLWLGDAAAAPPPFGRGGR